MGTIFVDNIKDNVGGKEINIGDGSLNVASDGSVGIRTTSPSDNLEITPSADEKGLTLKTTANIRPYINLESNRSSAGNNIAQINFLWNGTDVARIIGVAGSDTTNKDDGHITFQTASAGSTDERMRIASDGNVGIGTTSPDTQLHIENTSGNGSMQIISSTSGTSFINMGDTGDADIGQISYLNSNNNMLFKTGTAEAMRILDGSGNPGVVLVGKDQDLTASAGVTLSRAGSGFTRGTGGVCSFNRQDNDGDIIFIQQASTSEGKISVSGSTVSYEGFSGLHESSGIPTDTPVGTVVSTIDELDVYSAKQEGLKGEEDNPKAGKVRPYHAKVEVSSTVGDKAVYGVVSSFNEQDKVMVASVGIGSVRVTGACVKGDLLESNGDGTAKVQSDGIVRSKTLGKVTIGNSSSSVKLVSCVLYCG